MGQSQPSCPCVNGQDGRVCCVTPSKWPRLSELPLGACKAAGSPVAQGQQPSLCTHRGAMCRVRELAGGGPPPRPQAASARQPPPQAPGCAARAWGWVSAPPDRLENNMLSRSRCLRRRPCSFHSRRKVALLFPRGGPRRQPVGKRAGRAAAWAGRSLPAPPAPPAPPPQPASQAGRPTRGGGCGGQGRAPSRSELRCSWLRLLPQLGDEAAPGPGPRPRLWRGRLRGCLEGAPQASPSWSLGCGPWADVPCTAHNTHVALEHTMHTRDGTHMHTLHGGHTCWHTPTHCAVHTCDETHTFCIVQHMMALTLTHLHSAHM